MLDCLHQLISSVWMPTRWEKATSVMLHAFSHLVGIHTLNMSDCRQFTDVAFSHLAGIHTLDMSGCRQSGITDVAFSHLAGIHTLDMSWCNQSSITDVAFSHLAGIHTHWI